MIQKNMIKCVTLSVFAVFASNAMDDTHNAMDNICLRSDAKAKKDRKNVLVAAKKGKLNKKPGDVTHDIDPLESIVKKESSLESPYKWSEFSNKSVTFKRIPETKKPSKSTQVTSRRNTYDPELENLYVKRTAEFADIDNFEMETEIRIPGSFTPDSVNKQNQPNTPAKRLKRHFKGVRPLPLNLSEERGLSSSEEEMGNYDLGTPSTPSSPVKSLEANKRKTRTQRSFTIDGREIVTAATKQKDAHADNPVKQHPEFLERIVEKHEQKK